MSSQIIDEAARLFVSLRDSDGDPAPRAQLAQWLLKSPEHVRAYLDLVPIWEDAATIRTNLPDAEALIARARAEMNVVSFTDSERRAEAALSEAAASPANACSAGRSARYGLAASIVALVIAGVLVWSIGRPTVYATGIGEQRSVALPDGSRIELNSRTRLQVRYSEDERVIDLLEGQGLFEVAKDSQRPFIVRSDGVRVRAVGTQFDVYRKSTGTVVTVVEGRVEAGALQLKAGEQVIVAEQGIVRTEKPNIDAATAWTHRQLVFDSAPLDTVVAEFNRYNFKRLVVRDAQLRSFPISGVFSSTDGTSLVQFLAEQPEIEVEQSDSEVIISRKVR